MQSTEPATTVTEPATTVTEPSTTVTEPSTTTPLDDFKTFVKNIKNKEKLKLELAKYVVYNETTQLVESLPDAGELFLEGKVRMRVMNFCTKKYNHAYGTDYKWR